MKKKLITKFQQGGSTGGFFSQYTPFYTPRQEEVEKPSKESATAPKKEDDPYLKELRSMLTSISGKALSNDISEIYNQATTMLENVELSGGKLSSRQYMGILDRLNDAMNSKQFYDEAKKESTSKGTLGDIAVSSDGGLYVRDIDTGNLTMISSDQYANNRDKYQALTNNDLLVLRNKSNSFTFNNDIIKSVGESISAEDIQKELKSILDTIQNQENKYEMYGSKSTGYNSIKGISDGIQQLVQGSMDTLDEDGFKINTSTKGVSDENKKLALNYIYNNLSIRSKNKLKALSAINRDGSPQENMINDIVSLIKFGKPTSESLEIDVTDESGRSKSKSGSTSEKDLGVYSVYNKVDKNKDILLEFNLDKEDKYLLHAKGADVPLLNSDNTPVKAGTYMNNVFEKGLSSYLDTEGASLANGDMLTSSDMDKILYRGGNVSIAYLPYKTVDGKKVIDREVSKRLSEFNKKLEENPGMDSIQKSKLAYEYGVQGLLSKSPLEKSENLHPFMIMKAYIPEDVAEKNGLNDIMDPLEGTEHDNAADMYNRARTVGKTKEQSKYLYTPEDAGWFWFDNDIYESQVFIPIQDNQLFGQLTAGTAPTIDKTVYNIDNQLANQPSRVNKIKSAF